MGEWRRLSLFEAIELQRGFDLPETQRRNGGVPVVASTSIVGWHDEARVPGPGVVIGRSGSIGGGRWVEDNFWPLNTTLWVKNFRQNDRRFIYYMLRSIDFSRFNAGSGVPTLNRNHLTSVDVLLPPLAEQRAIAGVLGALDDKIESNRRLSSTARALIRLEIASADKSDWETVPLSGIAQFVNGGAYTKNASGDGRMVVRIAELNNGPGGSTIYNDIDVPDDKVARVGDLLMSWSGSLGVYVWVRPEAIVNQHIFKVIGHSYPNWLVFTCIDESMPFFRQTAADKATTMGHIKRHHLDDAKVLVPSTPRLSAIDEYLGPIWERLILAEVEALELAALRDALLPELLSGRMRVKDAEKIVEGAV